MTETTHARDREPSSFEEALASFDAEVRQRAPRRVTLEEIVEIVRADREASDR